MERSGIQTEVPLQEEELSQDLSPAPLVRNEDGEMVPNQAILQRANYIPPSWPQPHPIQDVVTLTRGEYTQEIKEQFEHKARRGQINYAFSQLGKPDREMGKWERKFEAENPPNPYILARVAIHLFRGKEWAEAALLAAQEPTTPGEEAWLLLEEENKLAEEQKSLDELKAQHATDIQAAADKELQVEAEKKRLIADQKKDTKAKNKMTGRQPAPLAKPPTAEEMAKDKDPTRNEFA